MGTIPQIVDENREAIEAMIRVMDKITKTESCSTGMAACTIEIELKRILRECPPPEPPEPEKPGMEHKEYKEFWILWSPTANLAFITYDSPPEAEEKADEIANEHPGTEVFVMHTVNRVVATKTVWTTPSPF